MNANKIEFRPADTDDLRTKVKICGITKLDDARFAAGAMADYLGFIFSPNSPRFVEPAAAAEIISWIEGPETVGIFVDQPLREVNDIIEKTGIHYVQLHGDESPEYCASINRPVIKAFRIKPDMSENDIRKLLKPYERIAWFFLLDSFDASQHGGTGRQFDWNVVRSVTQEYPVFLAGGIGLLNVRRAIRMVKPYTVDVNSSLEMQPGIKDFDKMNEFFDEMRSIWNEQEAGTF
jgi:phosphoribosylanthranilate isomerase